MVTEQTRPAVMILGTFHFDNPGLDVINIPVGDMLGERRQAEIADVVGRLAQFAPTAVALEIEPSAADTFNQRYRDYRAGTFALTANEIYQLGFRVAAACDLPQIHAVDWQGPFGFEAMAAFAQTHGQQDILDATMAEFQRRSGTHRRIAARNRPRAAERRQ